jgi:outer membrane protein assembly factor BamB
MNSSPARCQTRGIVVKSLLGVLFAGAALGAEWPEYHGPTHDSVSTEQLARWKDEPQVLWRIKMGEGFGSFAVAGGKAYLTCEDAGQEKLVALDVTTGKPAWAAPMDKTTIHEREGGNGPRSTPAVDGDRVYVMGTYLKLECFDRKTGKPVWGHDLKAEYQGQTETGGIRQWGSAQSPVIEGDLVFVAGGGPGKSLMAFDKQTGNLVWARGDEKLTHATPTIATILGVRQIIYYAQSGLVACEPASGKELWRFPCSFKVSVAASPTVCGDIVYCSQAYGVGAAACQISKEGDRFAAKELWRDKQLMNHWSSPVCKDGYVYGLYGWKALETAPLKCVEVKTGKVVWSHDGFGQGGIQLVGDQLVVQGDRGQIAVVEASPQGYHEVARTQPLRGKCWNMAVVSDGKLFSRSTTEVVCLDVSGR